MTGKFEAPSANYTRPRSLFPQDEPSRHPAGSAWLRPGLRTSARAAVLALAWTGVSLASPVLMVGSGTEKVNTTQMVVMQKDGMSAVTLMTDYQGPLSGFAIVFPVPEDVDAADVVTLKREYVDRVDLVSAPRFAEFWEMDPCEPGKPQQTWERNMTASADTGFLGVMQTDPAKKVEKELLLDVVAKTKDGEFKEVTVGTADEVKAWLSAKKYTLPAGAEAAFAAYPRFAALDVNTSRIELIGGDRGQLSPVRFVTESTYTTVPARFGLSSIGKGHELLVYAMADQRLQVENYPTKPVPTNLSLDFKVKERMGEYFTALQDIFLAKNPGTFWAEYAFSTADCGKPCPTEPLLPHELLSLGGDAFEAKLSEEVRRPDPPEPTAEDLAKRDASLEGKTPKEKKVLLETWKEDREELAARKAMIERQTYVLSRLHYRYATPAELAQDPKLVAGAAIAGGTKLPEGPEGAADLSVAPAEKNEFQTRYNNLHPNISVMKCETPERYKWGKPPRTYRGSSRIWVAEDLARKNRKQIDPVAMTLTAVPELGLPGRSLQEKPKEAAPPPAPEAKKEGCGCHAAGTDARLGLGAWLLSALALGALWRRRGQLGAR
jgi:MYXO-CTERM domain-containing protein